jgi:hypothetical protein
LISTYSGIQDERWNVFNREQIRDKDDNLDIGLIDDDSLTSYEDLPDPIESAEEAISKLEQAISLLNEVVRERVSRLKNAITSVWRKAALFWMLFQPYLLLVTSAP